MKEEHRLAAATALRALNNAFVEQNADDELLDRITEFARETVDQLRSAGRRDLTPLLAKHVARMFRVDGTDATDEMTVNPMTDRAVGGETNPTSVDFDYEYAGDEVVVRTVLGGAYEGAPGRAHGGMVAAVFDDITGFLMPLAGTAAYTGELTVRYHRPVPIGTVLEFRTRIERREGRKLHVTADCRAGEEKVATAEALFIAVDVDDFGKSPG